MRRSTALEAAGDAARGATVYVTLEPCCHHGKTPPCTQALFAPASAASSSRWRIRSRKWPAGNCGAAGGRHSVRRGRARRAKRGDCLAPYLKRVTTGRPWVIAKWAMTLDGKLATRTGDSQWISSEAVAGGRASTPRPGRCGHGRQRHGAGRQSAAHRPAGRSRRLEAHRDADRRRFGRVARARQPTGANGPRCAGARGRCAWTRRADACRTLDRRRRRSLPLSGRHARSPRCTLCSTNSAAGK